MMGIKKVVAGSRNRKREKKMNATTQAKTRNVYVREIMMPVIFCKDCKYWVKDYVTEDDLKYYHGNKDMCIRFGEYKEIPMNADDFCSRGERKKLTEF